MKTFDSSRFFYQNSGKGIVRTPEELAQEMLSKIPEYIFESSTTTFLDPACGRGTFLEVIAKRLKGYGHSRENIISRIFGIDIDPIKSGINEAKYILNPENIIVQDFLKMDLPTNWPKKFDVEVVNPPYKGRLHTEFLEKCYDLLGEDGKMIFVHPTNWLLHLRENSNYKKDLALKNKIGKHFVSFDFRNPPDLFPEGGCSPYYPLTITTVDKSKTSPEITFINKDAGVDCTVSNISDVNHIGPFNLIKSIESKIKLKSSIFIKDSICNNLPDKHYVSLNWMGGNGFMSTEFTDGVIRTFKNRYNFINNDNNLVSQETLRSKPQGSKTVGNSKAGMPFDSNQNAQDFLYYVTSTFFVKYLIIAYNMDQNLKSAFDYVPMIDFSLMRSDEMIFKFFEFTEEEINLIKKTVDTYKHA